MDNVISIGTIFRPRNISHVMGLWESGYTAEKMSQSSGLNVSIFRAILKREVPKIAPVTKKVRR